MENQYSNSLPTLVANGWVVETNEGYMLTPIGIGYYSVWSKSTKDKSEISKQIFSKTKPLDPEEVDTILKSLLDNKLVCEVYDPMVGGTVTKSTISGDKLFKTIEYYIDTKRVNKDIEEKKKEIKKAQNKVRNQKMMGDVGKGFEKGMGLLTDMMVKIAKAQTGQEQKKGKARKKSKPKKQDNPFGNMENMWKL